VVIPTVITDPASVVAVRSSHWSEALAQDAWPYASKSGLALTWRVGAGDDQEGLHPPEQLAPLDQPCTEATAVRVPDLDGKITQPVGEDLMQGDDLVVGEFDIHGYLHGSFDGSF
jgi:hypothetical protein